MRALRALRQRLRAVVPQVYESVTLNKEDVALLLDALDRRDEALREIAAGAGTTGKFSSEGMTLEGIAKVARAALEDRP